LSVGKLVDVYDIAITYEVHSIQVDAREKTIAFRYSSIPDRQGRKTRTIVS